MFTCAIIAGGKSTRMGIDKQTLYICEKNIEILQKDFAEVLVVTYKPHIYEKFGLKTCQDVIKNQGPLGGIHSALLHSNYPFVYTLACDMPNINREYIKFIKDKILSEKKEACVSRYKNHIEPFHGIYSKACINKIEEDLNNNKASIKKALEKIETLYISEKETRRFTPNWDMFINLNTKEEYERFLVV